MGNFQCTVHGVLCAGFKEPCGEAQHWVTQAIKEGSPPPGPGPEPPPAPPRKRLAPPGCVLLWVDADTFGYRDEYGMPQIREHKHATR